MFTELNFDITLFEVPVNLGGKQYVLREATGDAVRKYRNAVLKCTRPTSDGRVTIAEGIADVEPLLISLCLFEKKEDKLIPVQPHTIGQWPSKVQNELFKECKRISGIEQDDTIEQVEKRIKEDQLILEELKKKSEEDKEKN